MGGGALSPALLAAGHWLHWRGAAPPRGAGTGTGTGSLSPSLALPLVRVVFRSPRPDDENAWGVAGVKQGQVGGVAGVAMAAATAAVIASSAAREAPNPTGPPAWRARPLPGAWDEAAATGIVVEAVGDMAAEAPGGGGRGRSATASASSFASLSGNCLPDIPRVAFDSHVAAMTAQAEIAALGGGGAGAGAGAGSGSLTARATRERRSRGVTSTNTGPAPAPLSALDPWNTAFGCGGWESVGCVLESNRVKPLVSVAGICGGLAGGLWLGGGGGKEGGWVPPPYTASPAATAYAASFASFAWARTLPLPPRTRSSVQSILSSVCLKYAAAEPGAGPLAGALAAAEALLGATKKIASSEDAEDCVAPWDVEVWGCDHPAVLTLVKIAVEAAGAAGEGTASAPKAVVAPVRRRAVGYVYEDEEKVDGEGHGQGEGGEGGEGAVTATATTSRLRRAPSANTTDTSIAVSYASERPRRAAFTLATSTISQVVDVSDLSGDEDDEISVIRNRGGLRTRAPPPPLASNIRRRGDTAPPPRGTYLCFSFASGDRRHSISKDSRASVWAVG